MGPIAAVKTCLSKYVGFGGRAGRSEFWWFFLFYLIAAVVALSIDASARGGGIIYAIVVLGLVLPLLSAEFRRLHDTGHSGWWLFITLIPLIGTIWLLVLLASRGDQAPNKYGNTQLAGSAAA